ncbi:hypothetical protein LZ31DRAFT_96246 [Colletotrichum somersetense]|nr:hypothetical protein LZ31DRAFT_96246 [Colletotrichum somersetense]
MHCHCHTFLCIPFHSPRFLSFVRDTRGGTCSGVSFSFFFPSSPLGSTCHKVCLSVYPVYLSRLSVCLCVVMSVLGLSSPRQATTRHRLELCVRRTAGSLPNRSFVSPLSLWPLNFGLVQGVIFVLVRGHTPCERLRGTRGSCSLILFLFLQRIPLRRAGDVPCE